MTRSARRALAASSRAAGSDGAGRSIRRAGGRMSCVSSVGRGAAGRPGGAVPGSTTAVPHTTQCPPWIWDSSRDASQVGQYFIGSTRRSGSETQVFQAPGVEHPAGQP